MNDWDQMRIQVRNQLWRKTYYETESYRNTDPEASGHLHLILAQVYDPISQEVQDWGLAYSNGQVRYV